MKTLAIFAFALFAVVMAQDKVKVVDNNNPILPDSLFNQPSAPRPHQPQQGYERPSIGPAFVEQNQNQPGGYRAEWEAHHNVAPGARGGKK